MAKRLKARLHEIIFEADTWEGKAFDIVLFVCIIASVLVVMLDSVKHYHESYGEWFYTLEWVFTLVFTFEYVLRLYTVKKASSYAFSFFGVVDLLSILPTYISLFVPGAQMLMVIRFLRVLRIFRVLKIAQFIQEIDELNKAVAASRRKIMVFIFTVISLTVVIGSLMYLIEGEENGFTSIPRSIYWAIVTLTTVGYGDISPQTPLGQFFAVVVMIAGYGIIAVPTGIVSAELSRVNISTSTQSCRSCGCEDHAEDAVYCKKCGEKL